MEYHVVLQKIEEPEFEGEYYAYIPALDLTTQGMGVEGARAAAYDLILGWIQVKRAHGESVGHADDGIITIEITEDALQAA